MRMEYFGTDNEARKGSVLKPRSDIMKVQNRGTSGSKMTSSSCFFSNKYLLFCYIYDILVKFLLYLRIHCE